MQRAGPVYQLQLNPKVRGSSSCLLFNWYLSVLLEDNAMSHSQDTKWVWTLELIQTIFNRIKLFGTDWTWLNQGYFLTLQFSPNVFCKSRNGAEWSLWLVSVQNENWNHIWSKKAFVASHFMICNLLYRSFPLRFSRTCQFYRTNFRALFIKRSWSRRHSFLAGLDLCEMLRVGRR